MKTLMVILALAIGTMMGANAQTQSKPQSKPAAHPTTQATTQTTGQAQAQPQTQNKTMIKIPELPKAIQDNLASQFKGWTPQQAYKLDSKGVISYEVMVKKEANEKIIIYDKDGKFMKEEPVTAMKPENKKEAAPAKPASKPK
jgi:hypothetical protein